MMEIPSQTTRRASRAFMEATEDTEGIMVSTGNGSTKVVVVHVLKEKESS